MCNLYSLTRSQEAIRCLFRIARDLMGSLPGLPNVYPDTMAPVVRVAVTASSPDVLRSNKRR